MKHYPCRHPAGPITIEGRLDELAWQVCARADDFHAYPDFSSDAAATGPLKPRFRTQAMALWDARFLYIGMAGVDDCVWATETRYDVPLWHEEVMEIFIDPGGEGRPYVELQINPRNAVRDVLVENIYLPRQQWDWQQWGAWQLKGLEHAVHIFRDELLGGDLGWSVELAIPWEGLRAAAGHAALPPRPGDRWRINFYRYDRPQGRPAELSAWCYTESDTFHVPSKFGVLEFLDET